MKLRPVQNGNQALLAVFTVSVLTVTMVFVCSRPVVERDGSWNTKESVIAPT